MKTGIKPIFLLVACVMINFAKATTRRVLFIGNSYTYVNNMPLMLQTMATAMGDTLIYDESDPGGYTFEQHSTYGPTITKIFSQPWDVVVLQEQSQRPSFPPAQVMTDVYPYARVLDSLIHANDTCTQTMFLMTWGRSNGDAMNCVSYPMVCTYAGMQLRLRESYLQMTQDNDAVVAPVGVAWKVIKDSFPSINLYQSDSSHPSVEGSYLETAVIYGSIFHKRTYGCTYSGTLATSIAQTLQRVSDRIVFDSLNYWQQYGHYPAAIFTQTITGSTVAYTQHSPVTAGHFWTFGDGGTNGTLSPSHAYAATGNYIVRHTVTTDCFTETFTDTISVGTTGLTDASIAKAVVMQYPGSGKISILTEHNVDVLEIVDLSGRVVRRYYDTNIITDVFNPGIYLYRLLFDDKSVVSGKFIVH